VVSVQDTGIGISQEDQKKIFSCYYRTEPGKKAAKGFGVGLAFTKTMIEAHGSAIMLKSSPGKGSRFYFSLPLWEEASSPPQNGRAQAADYPASRAAIPL